MSGQPHARNQQPQQQQQRQRRRPKQDAAVSRQPLAQASHNPYSTYAQPDAYGYDYYGTQQPTTQVDTSSWYLQQLYDYSALLANQAAPATARLPQVRQLRELLLQYTTSYELAVAAASVLVWPESEMHNVYGLQLEGLPGLHGILLSFKNHAAASREIGWCFATVGFSLMNFAPEYAQQFVDRAFNVVKSSSQQPTPTYITRCYVTALTEMLNPKSKSLPGTLFAQSAREWVAAHLAAFVQHIADLCQDQPQAPEAAEHVGCLLKMLLKHWMAKQELFFDMMLTKLYVWLATPTETKVDRSGVQALTAFFKPLVTAQHLPVFLRTVDVVVEQLRTELRMPFLPPYSNELAYTPHQTVATRTLAYNLSSALSALEDLLLTLGQLSERVAEFDRALVRRAVTNAMHLLLTISDEFRANLEYLESAGVSQSPADALVPVRLLGPVLFTKALVCVSRTEDGKVRSATRLVDMLVSAIAHWPRVPSELRHAILSPGNCLMQCWQGDGSDAHLELVRLVLSMQASQSADAAQQSADDYVLTLAATLSHILARSPHDAKFELDETASNHLRVLQDFVTLYGGGHADHIASAFEAASALDQAHFSIGLWVRHLDLWLESIDAIRNEHVQAAVVSYLVALFLPLSTNLHARDGLELLRVIAQRVIACTNWASASSESGSQVWRAALSTCALVCELPVLSTAFKQSCLDVLLTLQSSMQNVESAAGLVLDHFLIPTAQRLVAYSSDSLKLSFAKLWMCYLDAPQATHRLPHKAFLSLTERACDADRVVGQSFAAIVARCSVAQVWQLGQNQGDVASSDDSLQTKIKRAIMASAHTGSFRPPHFAIVMRRLGLGQMLPADAGLPSSDDLADSDGFTEWLVDLFHSCQGLRLIDTAWHGLNYSLSQQLNIVQHARDTLEFFALWEAGRYCVLSRLRTPFGNPTQTLDAIRRAVLACNDTPDIFGSTDEQRSAFERAVLLCRFVDCLHKHLMNAFDGNAANVPPAVPRMIAQSFRELQQPCTHWMRQTWPPLIQLCFRCGQWALALRHGMLLLNWEVQHPSPLGLGDIVQTLRAIATSCRMTSDPETILGVQHWLSTCQHELDEHARQVLLDWLQAEHAYALTHLMQEHFEEARARYRQAYRSILLSTEPKDFDGLVTDMYHQINETFLCLKDYTDVAAWTSELPDPATDQLSVMQQQALEGLSTHESTTDTSVSMDKLYSKLYVSRCQNMDSPSQPRPPSVVESMVVYQAAADQDLQGLSLAGLLMCREPLRGAPLQFLEQPLPEERHPSSLQLQAYIQALRRRKCYATLTRLVSQVSPDASLWCDYELLRVHLELHGPASTLQALYDSVVSAVAAEPAADETKSTVYRKLATWLNKYPELLSPSETARGDQIQAFFEQATRHDDTNSKAWWQWANFAYASAEGIVSAAQRGDLTAFMDPGWLGEGSRARTQSMQQNHLLLVKGVRQRLQASLDIGFADLLVGEVDPEATISKDMERLADDLLSTTTEHFRTATHSYFRFLELQGYESTGAAFDAMVAALHLLHLLWSSHTVWQELFADRFELTGASCWLPLIPQMLSRIDHPNAFVQQQLAWLLAKVTVVYPQAILYEIITMQRSTLSPATQESLRLVEDALGQYHPELVPSTSAFVEHMLKISVLWEETWYNRLTHIQGELFKRIAKLDPEFKRLANDMSLTARARHAQFGEYFDVIVSPATQEIQRLCDTHLAVPKTPHEQWFVDQFRDSILSSLEMLKSPEGVEEPRACWQGFKEVHRALGRLLTKPRVLQLAHVNPALMSFDGSAVLLPGQTASQSTLGSVGKEFHVLPSKTKPKKLSLNASDGSCHHYLFKGVEDLHLDERVMQFIATINQMLQQDRSSAEQRLRARHYAVVPFGSSGGFIQWVENATPMYTLYKKWQRREAVNARPPVPPAAAADKRAADSTAPAEPPKPNELWHMKLAKHFKQRDIRRPPTRSHCKPDVLEDVFRELVRETPDDLIAREFSSLSCNAHEWLARTHSFAKSTAVMSGVGYILGLGDRHLDNILLDLHRGEVIHIDYDVSFEKGARLRVPECVPFRLTQNVVGAFGQVGLHGLFRETLQRVLHSMWEHREVLMLLLETFVYDPLINWSENADDEKDRRITELNVDVALVTARLGSGRLKAVIADTARLLSRYAPSGSTEQQTLMQNAIDQLKSVIRDLKPLIESVVESVETVTEAKHVPQILKNVLESVQKLLEWYQKAATAAAVSTSKGNLELVAAGKAVLSVLKENVAAVTAITAIAADESGSDSDEELSQRKQAGSAQPAGVLTKNAVALLILARIREKLEFRDNGTGSAMNASETRSDSSFSPIFSPSKRMTRQHLLSASTTSEASSSISAAAALPLPPSPLDKDHPTLSPMALASPVVGRLQRPRRRLHTAVGHHSVAAFGRRSASSSSSPLMRSNSGSVSSFSSSGCGSSLDSGSDWQGWSNNLNNNSSGLLDSPNHMVQRKPSSPAALPTVAAKRLRRRKSISFKYTASWKRQFYAADPQSRSAALGQRTPSSSSSLSFYSSPILAATDLSVPAVAFPLCCSNTWYLRGEAFLFGLAQPGSGHAGYPSFCYVEHAAPQPARVDEATAVLCFHRAADLGHTLAIALLGFCYEFGLGVEHDFSAAERYYVEAANAPHHEPLSMARLAFLRRYGRPNVRMDRAEANVWRDKLRQMYLPFLTQDITASASFSDAGDLYSSEDPLVWLRWAAGVIKHPAAQYSLGTCYHDGVGTRTPCPNEAVRWYRLSAEQGHPRGEGILGYCYGEAFGVERNQAMALHWYTQAAQKGETVAMYNVGYCFEEGIGVKADFEVALGWYLRAARQGNALAANSLGYFYEEGLGTERNLPLSVYWYRVAAEQGNPWAQHNLAYLYSAGLGVSIDQSLALYWYRKAAEQGHAGAQNKLGYYLQTGASTTPNPIAAVYWYTKSAEQGYTSACMNLVWCLERGIGCVRNIQQAVYWLDRALEKFKENLDATGNDSLSSSAAQEEAALVEWLAQLSLRLCMERALTAYGVDETPICGAALAA
ncbi:hypothetical protein RI367_003150 [Sorochytrium milnesiophthora]